MEKQSFLSSLFCVAVILTVASARGLHEQMRCMMACPEGQILRTDACVCEDVDFPPVETACPLHRCPAREFLPCERYKLDENGCQTCVCQCYKFLLNCPHDCRYGSEYITNSNGCKVCQCAGANTFINELI